ncbi:MAG: Flp pilus assembly protein TadD [Candidatus Azotimanducaceae bacterium]|jgi:Flp pilus assembly protein TadD
MLNKPLTVSILMLALSGCASSLDYPYSDAVKAELLVEALGDEQPLQELITLDLDDDLKAALDARIDARWRPVRKLRALRSFLFSEEEVGISYDASSSRTAMGTYRSGEGNCLAMTNLFVAAGRYVGLDASYQTVSVKPTWDHEGETMIRYKHIVAAGRIEDDTYVVDFLPTFLIGDRPSEKIDDFAAMALYFNNLGAEALVKGQTELSIEHLRQALALSPDNADSWNNMGAAMRRAGNNRVAVFAYYQALQKDAYNYSALSNLARYYESEGRADEALEIAARVGRYRRRNPYYHYFVAKLVYQEGLPNEAQEILNSAIRLKRDEPEFYEASAQISRALGNEVESDRYLAKAKHYRSMKHEKPPERTMNHRLLVRKNM